MWHFPWPTLSLQGRKAFVPALCAVWVTLGKPKSKPRTGPLEEELTPQTFLHSEEWKLSLSVILKHTACAFNLNWGRHFFSCLLFPQPSLLFCLGYKLEQEPPGIRIWRQIKYCLPLVWRVFIFKALLGCGDKLTLVGYVTYRGYPTHYLQ